MSWLEEQIETGGGYLDGKDFSRLDLAAASLLSPLALPPEMKLYRGFDYPPSLKAVIANWSGRPAIEWTRKIYATCRDRRSA